MARLVAILKALLRSTWRGDQSLGSFATNNFFLVTAILLQHAGAFLYLIAGLVMLFPLSRDPLRKVPAARLSSWPLTRGEHSLLRLVSPWTSPATWIVAGLLAWSAVRSAGFGLPAVLAVLVAVGFLLPRVSGAGEATVWRVVPGFPLPLRELVRKNLRDLVSTLDFYCAAVLALSGCVYRLVSANPDPDMTLGVTLLVVLALTSYGQCLFGLDGRPGLMRYRLMPLRGWWILAVKGGPYLAVVVLLTLPLAPLAGLSAGLAALAVGHSESVSRSSVQTRWRFTSGSSISNSLSQVVAMTLAGVATFRITPFAVIGCAVIYAVSVWWYGRKMEDQQDGRPVVDPILRWYAQGEMSVWTQILAIAVAVLVGYLYAATRNWVWCPKWLERFVYDEKRR